MRRLQIREPEIVRGSTYIETLILTYVSNAIKNRIPYNEAMISLAKMLEEEILSLIVKDDLVKEIFISHLKKYFKELFGEKVPVPKFKTLDIWRTLSDHLYEHKEKILTDFAVKEPSEIRKDIEPIVANLILVSAKATFRDLGYLR